MSDHQGVDLRCDSSDTLRIFQRYQELRQPLLYVGYSMTIVCTSCPRFPQTSETFLKALVIAPDMRKRKKENRRSDSISNPSDRMKLFCRPCSTA